MLTLNLSINKFFISLPSSFQRSLKKIRCLQNLLGNEWKIPYLMCYLPVWVRDNWKDLTNRNNSMEGSVQNIKKKIRQMKYSLQRIQPHFSSCSQKLQAIVLWLNGHNPLLESSGEFWCWKPAQLNSLSLHRFWARQTLYQERNG